MLQTDLYSKRELARDARKRLGRFTVAHFIQIMIIFAGAAVIFSRLDSQELQTHHIKWNDTQITLQEPWGDTYTIAYQDILSLQTTDISDPGTWVRGVETEESCYGIWNRPDYGDYHLFIRKSIPVGILIETQDGYTLLNLESEDVTTQLFDILSEKSSSS